jgi:hypothetical protein
VPEDPKWGQGPPLKPKEKKVLKERLQVLAEEPWRQQYLDLMLRYHDICSRDKFDLGCGDVIEHSIVMEDERQVHQRQFRVPFAHEEVLYEYVDKLLKSGAINGQPLTVQLSLVLRGKEATSQCSTWRSSTTTCGFGF